MTGIVEQKSLRYSWELVRHSYLVDIGNEIGIQQLEISPPDKHHLLDPPYPVTRFFEIEIDQIQKNGRTVFSFRNICPVQIDQKPELHLLNRRIGKGSRNITKRLHAQEGETETRWLYTSDFFLISVSSGDRHDLSTLLSLILGRLNVIALSILSGKRIRSEYENQMEYRNSIGTLFSNGVDGAFRDVPVYQQHGDITSRGPDEISSALSNPEHSIALVPPAGKFCGSCGAAISGTAKFCGSCGTAVNAASQAENAMAQSALVEIAHASSGIPAGADSEKVPSGSRQEAKLVIDVKTVEELQDLSWLSD
jgi:hypothetical protein